jgi:hypothetical protein
MRAALLAVRDPDVLDLGCLAEELTTLAVPHVEPCAAVGLAPRAPGCISAVEPAKMPAHHMMANGLVIQIINPVSKGGSSFLLLLSAFTLATVFLFLTAL